ncbi:hypothetical protein GCM10007884_50470 [Methylobacterium brachythecii]|nr:hypothetical protein GCM10007884_50470 [Methylobacterium brachythecii]
MQACGSTTAASQEAVHVQLSYDSSPALDACARAIKQGGAQIGAEPVVVHLPTDGEAAAATRSKVKVITLEMPRRPGGFLNNMWRSSWEIVRTPFLFKDMDHFRRFQQSAMAKEIGSGTMVAYGGASHLFSFRTAISEPKHVAGQLIRGGSARAAYQEVGSLAEPDWKVDITRQYEDESKTIPAEVSAAAAAISDIRRDRNGLAAIEAPLLSASAMGLESITQFLNLSFSTVDPIVLDASSLLKRASRNQKPLVEQWMRTIALQCSDAVRLEEDNLVKHYRGLGKSVVPVNRAGFAQAGWTSGLKDLWFKPELDLLDAIVDLAWPANLKRPSKLVEKVDAETKKLLLESRDSRRKKHEEEEALKKQSESIDETGNQALASAWADIRPELADALAKLPPPVPSGLTAGWLKPERRPKLEIVSPAAAEMLAGEVTKILDPIRSCSAEDTGRSVCEERILGWLNIARVRSGQWSSWLPWKSVTRTVDRAVQLAMPPDNATPRERLRAAGILRDIADELAIIQGRPSLHLVDLVAGLDLSSLSAHIEKDGDKEISTNYSVFGIDSWIVRNYRDLGYVDRAKLHVKKAQQHLIALAAAGPIREEGDEQTHQQYASYQMWEMYLLVGDYQQAWQENIKYLRNSATFSENYCRYGRLTCAARIDMRRARFLAAETLIDHLIENNAPNSSKNWMGMFIDAVVSTDDGGLDTEKKRIVDRVRSAFSGTKEFEELDKGLSQFLNLTAAQRRIVGCGWKGCPENEDDEEPKAPYVSNDPPSYRQSDHPFDIAVTNRDWDKAKDWYDQVMQVNGSDRSNTYDMMFPLYADRIEGNYKRTSVYELGITLGGEAAIASNFAIMQHVLQKEQSDAKEADDDKLKTLNKIFNIIVRKTL